MKEKSKLKIFIENFNVKYKLFRFNLTNPGVRAVIKDWLALIFVAIVFYLIYNGIIND